MDGTAKPKGTRFTVFVLEYKQENKTYRKKKQIDKYSAESTLSQISMGIRPNKKIKTFAYGNPTNDPICLGAYPIFFKQKKRGYTLHSPPHPTPTKKSTKKYIYFKKRKKEKEKKETQFLENFPLNSTEGNEKKKKEVLCY